MGMSIEEYKKLEKNGDKSSKYNKFNAQRTEYNGRTFHSKKEAERAQELDFLIQAGEVAEVEYQPSFSIEVNGEHICRYRADFRVTYPDGHVEIEDVKGYKKGNAYRIFKLKSKLLKATQGIDIKEI